MLIANIKKQTISETNESGNAFVYILIAVILFGSLSFMLNRSSTNTAAKSELDGAQLAFQVESIIKYTTEVQSVLARMQSLGTHPDDVDFILPSAAAFDTAPNFNKIYHSSGGGLYGRSLNENVIGSAVTTPDAGWYLGRFNNVVWTPSTAEDIILAAYNISENLCGALNKKLIGDSTIPSVSISPSAIFIDDSFGGAANDDFEVADCSACEGKPMLCVYGAGPGAPYTFYSIALGQ